MFQMDVDGLLMKAPFVGKTVPIAHYIKNRFAKSGEFLKNNFGLFSFPQISSNQNHIKIQLWQLLNKNTKILKFTVDVRNGQDTQRFSPETSESWQFHLLPLPKDKKNSGFCL